MTDLTKLSDEDLLVLWDIATDEAEEADWDEATTEEVCRIEEEVNRRGLGET